MSDVICCSFSVLVICECGSCVIIIVACDAFEVVCFFFQAEDGIRDLVRSRGLGDVYKRQGLEKA